MAESSYAVTNISFPDVRQKDSETSRWARGKPDVKKQGLPLRPGASGLTDKTWLMIALTLRA
jgi:hypothetical protein